nr:LytR C-terminal domain-containing protein [Corynebacterium lactis]
MSDQLNPQNSPRRGRHRLDDDFDDFDDFDEYSDYGEYATEAGTDSRSGAYVDAPEATVAASGAAGYAAASGRADAGATAADAEAAEYDESDDDAVTGAGAGAGAVAGEGAGAGDGRSLRILAAICLFIGVCLVGYGIYAYSSGGAGSSETAASSTSTSAQGSATNGANGQDKGDSVAPPPPATVGESGKPVPPPVASEAPKSDAPAAPAKVDRATVKVTVLNNSQVTGLADKLSEKIGSQGWGRGATGNAPENEMGVWERTTVVFDPAKPQEKAAAEELANQNGWVAVPRDQRFDGKPAGIVVIATDPAQ